MNVNEWNVKNKWRKKIGRCNEELQICSIKILLVITIVAFFICLSFGFYFYLFSFCNGVERFYLSSVLIRNGTCTVYDIVFNSFSPGFPLVMNESVIQVENKLTNFTFPNGKVSVTCSFIDAFLNNFVQIAQLIVTLIEILFVGHFHFEKRKQRKISEGFSGDRILVSLNIIDVGNVTVGDKEYESAITKLKMRTLSEDKTYNFFFWTKWVENFLFNTKKEHSNFMAFETPKGAMQDIQSLVIQSAGDDLQSVRSQKDYFKRMGIVYYPDDSARYWDLCEHISRKLSALLYTSRVFKTPTKCSFFWVLTFESKAEINDRFRILLVREDELSELSQRESNEVWCAKEPCSIFGNFGFVRLKLIIECFPLLYRQIHDEKTREDHKPIAGMVSMNSSANISTVGTPVKFRRQSSTV